ncbi:UNVERIFIED_CONTAM: protein PMR5 [Sesamum radiatum]|uniref:Protein PMR5 n=1 Tax=Sesamum radiatum TaxID=300843 RepID=A0AAW2UM05_SESRA
MFSVSISLYNHSFMHCLVRTERVIGGAGGAEEPHTHNPQHRNPMLHTNQTSCALFMGSWVRDDSYPLYQYSCPVIDSEFNCQMYGRPDTDYLKFRWQPANCQIPRFNGGEFAMRMRGKNVMFVGDSLGRNQWQSLICMISAGISPSSYEAPYLVDIDLMQGKRVLRLDEIRGNANAWTGVDVLSFNTGHWWTHKGSLQGWDYMEAEGSMYEDMDRLVALERGLRTWAKWVDANIDTSRSRVFFQGISPTHYNPSEWNAGAVTTSKSCYGETMPMTGMSGYAGTYPDQMKVVQVVLSSMNKPPFLLDITLLSAMRKDAHPSIYSGDLTPSREPIPTILPIVAIGACRACPILGTNYSTLLSSTYTSIPSLIMFYLFTLHTSIAFI